EQATRREHVLAGEKTGARGAPGGDRLTDCPVLEVVLLVQVVDVEAGSPDDMREEAPACTLRQTLDERCVGRGVDHVVEGVVRVHPACHQRAVLCALARAAPKLE